MNKRLITSFLIFFSLTLNVVTGQNLRIYNKNVPLRVGAHFYDYQNYHNIAYFHGGLDLVAPAGTNVYTPISGTVQVYDYTINAVLDPPSFTYFRKPFKKGTVSTTRYLEVAVRDETTKKTWMFRHIEPISLPDAIYTAAENNSKIASGTLIGRVAAWIQPVLPEKDNYDHIHIEIEDEDGNYINPADYLQLDKDYYPPVCKELYVLKTDTNRAYAYSTNNEKLLSGKVKFYILANDRMNSTRYLHSLHSIKWSFSKINNQGKDEIVIPQKEVFAFDKLPFKGDRTQLSKVIYEDSLRINGVNSSNRVRANGSNGPRVFLINLNSGTTLEGYSNENVLDTSTLENGTYKLKLLIQDFSRNKREKTYLFRIKN
ncbi:MAG: hypothetical protein PHF29_05190 [Candidatus Riflebacteria bacterium]|nr:hypothetical protein [Candidatus Riflebacteria bacterium]